MTVSPSTPDIPATPAAQPSAPLWFLEGMRQALTGPAFYVALSLMGVGSLTKAADFPLGVALVSTVLVWAGPGQLLFFSAIAAKTPLPAIALAVSLSSVRLTPMCLSVLPMLRSQRRRTSKLTLLAAAHFIAVTVWAESLRRLPDIDREARLPFFFGFALTCMGLTTLSAAFGFWLAGALPLPLAAGLLMLSPIYFLAATARSARNGADWLAVVFGAALAPLAVTFVGGGFDLPLLALVGGGGAWAIGFYARRRAA